MSKKPHANDYLLAERWTPEEFVGVIEQLRQDQQGASVDASLTEYEKYRRAKFLAERIGCLQAAWKLKRGALPTGMSEGGENAAELDAAKGE